MWSVRVGLENFNFARVTATVAARLAPTRDIIISFFSGLQYSTWQAARKEDLGTATRGLNSASIILADPARVSPSFDKASSFKLQARYLLRVV